MTQSISPVVHRAQMLAYQLNQTLRDYQKELANVHAQLERAAADVMSAAQSSWTNATSARAGNVVTFVSKIDQNMRLDLLVQNAGQIDALRAELDALLKYMLVDDEKEKIRAILAMGE